jgi:hypothetical protein
LSLSIARKKPIGPATKAAVTVSLIVMLTGCAVPFPVYTVSSTNISTIRSAERSIELGPFTGDQASVSCRLQPITPEGGRTFAQYIRAAFADELVIAGNTPSKPKVPLSARLINIDVSCNSFDSNWEIELEVTVADQAPFVIKTVRRFDYTFLGAAMLPRAYQAYVPAIQDTVANVLTHPSVRRVLTQ